MASNNKNPTKRKFEYLDSDSEEEFDSTVRAWPRFLVVEGVDPERPLRKFSPFAVHTFFKGVSSEITNVKKMKDGAFLVECPSEKASRSLQRRNETDFIDRPIRVSEHKTLNTCKGVIRCRELEDVSDQEIEKELKKQGVIEVQRITRKKGDTRVPTNTFFLTFQTTSLPPKIKIGFLQVDVSLFIPSPLRCFKCQCFGHSRGRCQKAEICEHCGQAAHENACSQPPICSNCKGNHSPSSRECPTFKFEKEIQRIKTEKKMTFAEARKEAEKSLFLPSLSYASAVKSRQTKGSEQGVQVGQPLPEKVIEQLRKEFCKGKEQPVAPAKTSEQGTGTTQPSAGSSTSAPAPQAAEAKQAPKPAQQVSRPACSKPQPPARQEVAEVNRSDPPTPLPSQREVRAGLTEFFYKADKYLPRSSQKKEQGTKEISRPSRPSPDRLKKAEKDLVTSNRFGPLSDGEEDFMDC